MEITEEQIGDLVETFYAKVRVDPEIGPIFNAIVSDWPHHLSVLKDFWVYGVVNHRSLQRRSCNAPHRSWS